MAPVLMLHSGGFSSRQWRALARALAPDHRVLTPNLLGYDEAAPWPLGEPFHHRQDVAALEALLEPEHEPVHVVGHSYGGFLALELALARPGSVRSLALFEPVAFGILDEPADEPFRAELARVPRTYHVGPNGADDTWLAGFVDWWNGPGAWDALVPETKDAFRRTGWKVFQEVLSLVTDVTVRAAYATIAAPTLLLGGERSPPTERRVLEKLATTLPRATLQLLPDAGHMGPITHARAVNRAIAEHLARA